MIVIVSYDLKAIKDYTPFYTALRAQGNWWHYLASTWLISTIKTPQQVTEAIDPFLSPQDFLLVTEMGSRYNGRLPKEAWNWIYQNSPPPVTLSSLGALSGPPGRALGGLPPLSGLGSRGVSLSDLLKPKK